ncbi:MAG: sodium:proton antiporter, partial [Lachnospiraceae bacterium]|nr:sodium:proton antiporter [Lachnospiraceae bacterium]
VEFTRMAAEGQAGSYLSAGVLQGVEWAFLISGGLTVAYMTKLYVALFIEKNQNQEIQRQFDSLKGHYMNKLSGIVLAVGATLLPVLGFLPDFIMGKLADMGQSLFVNGTAAGLQYVPAEGLQVMIDWFSLSSLKGAGISIGIGILVYLFVVRTLLMKRENGCKIYAGRWSHWLDLENLVYRPILLHALPFVCGVFCRVLDSLADGVVVLLRKTVYRDSKLPEELLEGNRFTHMAGRAANGLQRLGNRSIWQKNPRNVDYEHKFALIYQEWEEDSLIIGRSLSFGLLLFCAGLLLTVVYLLLAA